MPHLLLHWRRLTPSRLFTLNPITNLNNRPKHSLKCFFVVQTFLLPVVLNSSSNVNSLWLEAAEGLELRVSPKIHRFWCLLQDEKCSAAAAFKKKTPPSIIITTVSTKSSGNFQTFQGMKWLRSPSVRLFWPVREIKLWHYRRNGHSVVRSAGEMYWSQSW